MQLAKNKNYIWVVFLKKLTCTRKQHTRSALCHSHYEKVQSQIKVMFLAQLIA